MVHLRINEREVNPNPYINFIAALPMGDPTVEEASRQLLRSLAAQVKPIMKAHGFVVNSLEEYEYNRVFAGRNWNAGETIGNAISPFWDATILAHIKHMNHGPAFQTLWRQLQQEVRALQCRGYYGDGYWSSGTRLVDSAKIAGQGIEIGELPEYMCGGAHSRTRPVLRGPRRSKVSTFKKRKAGSRVHSNAFNTIGRTLNEELQGEKKSHGIGFRKKAGSKRAREERAQAAERRTEALQCKASSSMPSIPSDTGDGSEDEKGDVETDHDRRRTLLEVIEEKDLDALRAVRLDLTQNFLLPDLSSPGNVCGTENSRESAASTLMSGSGGSSGPSQIKKLTSDKTFARQAKRQKTSREEFVFTSHIAPAEEPAPWNCIVCTLTNEPNHLACSACSTPRGESKWIYES